MNLLQHLITWPQRLRRHWRDLTTQVSALQQGQMQIQANQQQTLERNNAVEHSLRHTQIVLSQLRADHDANIQWLQTCMPAILQSVADKPGSERFDQLTQDVLAALHRETGALIDRIHRLETGSHPMSLSDAPVNPPLSRYDSRADGFYLELERRFRGTAQDISARAQPYLELLKTPALAHCTPVLDLGCGRGEWLQLLRQHALPASGVDLNPINGDFCRAQGLLVATEDALSHLSHLPDASQGAVTAFHVVEHLPFGVLIAFTDEILRVLKPGGLLVYETPNPENLLVASQSFWIDPTHIRPLPPVLLQFLVEQRGFVFPELRRLHPANDTLETTDPALKKLLGGPRDYAVLAYKPS